MSSEHAQQLRKARDALEWLTNALGDLASALASDKVVDTLNAQGENVALAVDAMTSALAELDALGLSGEMQDETPSLEGVLAYLLAAGYIRDDRAPEMAAGIIEYASSAAYGGYPRNLEKFPGIKNYQLVTDAIEDLLNRLEQAP